MFSLHHGEDGTVSDASGQEKRNPPASHDRHVPRTMAAFPEPRGDPRAQPPGAAKTLDAGIGTLAGNPHRSAARGTPEHEFDASRYELQDEIGRGGMGVVYRARQKVLDRPVAIKMILTDKSASLEQIEILHAEARMAAKVRHPNIVGVYEIGAVHGWHYIAMELIEGRSLAQRDEQACRDPVAATRLLLPVVHAVAHLHARGIVHLDLKPANILLDSEDTPYVTDFGIARTLKVQAQRAFLRGRIAGTPNYMAPEQAAGRQEEVGIRSDIYSLGAVFYHLLTGRPPFQAPTSSETLTLVTRGDPVPPRRIRSSIPLGLELICLKCLEKDPARRYPSATALAADLERFIGGEPVEARPLSPPEKLLRWTRRETALALRLLAMGLFMAIEATLYAYGGTTAPTPFFHRTALIMLPLWALVSLGLNHGIHSSARPTRCQVLWAGVDITCLTLFCLASERSICGPLVAMYYVLIADSGLWYRPKVVWVATALSVTAYLGLLAEAHFRRPWIYPWIDIDTHIVHLTALIIVGVTVTYLSRCVWTLRRLGGRV